MMRQNSGHPTDLTRHPKIDLLSKGDSYEKQIENADYLYVLCFILSFYIR